MRIVIFACVMGMFATASVALAQADSASLTGSIVEGSGSTTLREMPAMMRMSIQFQETGKDTADALKKIKDRRAAATTLLTKLGATKEGLKESLPTRKAEEASAGGMPNRRSGGKKKAAAAKVTLISKLSCEWPLPQKGEEELLTFVEDLKDKVQAADLAGLKEKKKLTAEEQEEQEEMEMMQQQYGYNNEAKPGEPSFLFLATLSPEQQQKARTAAYEKSRQHSEQLAASAGKKLGKLRSLSGNDGTDESVSLRHYYMNGEMQTDDGATDSDAEGVGKSPQLGKITFTFTVRTSFELVD